MKRLLLILAGGGLAFMALAILQERDVFLRPWFAAPEAPRDDVSAEEAARAEGVVREMLALLRHVHGSGGDPRFVERLPASAALRDEIRSDADYVRANGLRQHMELVRLDLLGVDSAGAERLIVWTREYWQVRYTSLAGEPAREPSHAEVAYGRYVVGPEGGRLVVLGWEPTDPEPRQGTAP